MISSGKFDLNEEYRRLQEEKAAKDEEHYQQYREHADKAAAMAENQQNALYTRLEQAAEKQQAEEQSRIDREAEQAVDQAAADVRSQHSGPAELSEDERNDFKEWAHSLFDK